MHFVLLARQRLQQRKRLIMTGENFQDLPVAVQSLLQHILQLLSKPLDMRRHPRAGLCFGPHEALGEGCELSTFALRPLHQGLTQNALPMPQGSPHMPVGLSQTPGHVTDRSLIPQARQQIEERIFQ